MKKLYFLAYLLRHKLYLAYYSLRFFPLPIKTILIHDLDKLKNLDEYSQNYAGFPTDRSLFIARDHTFTQPHHFEHWQGYEIPTLALHEMLSDWLSAAQCKTGDARSALHWWIDHEDVLPIHVNTKQRINEIFKSKVGKSL